MTSTSHSFTRTDSFTLRTREKRKIADFDRVDSDRPWLVATCRAACTRSRVRRARADLESTCSCTHAASAAVRRSRFPRLCEIVGTRQRRPSRSARRRVAPQGSIASHISWPRRWCSRPPAHINMTRMINEKHASQCRKCAQIGCFMRAMGSRRGGE